LPPRFERLPSKEHQSGFKQRDERKFQSRRALAAESKMFGGPKLILRFGPAVAPSYRTSRALLRGASMAIRWVAPG
jgi:hypothetical protein